MKPIYLLLTSFFMLFLLVVSYGHSSNQKLPVIDGKEIVADVNGEHITLDELKRAVSSLHEEMTEEMEAGSIKNAQILKRLIITRLILLEAKNIEIDKLKEVRDSVDEYSQNTLIGLVRREHVKDMKADEEEVDRLYKEAVKEFKLKSVLLDNKDLAERIKEEITAQGNFEDIVKRIIADGTASESVEGKYIKYKTILPQIAEALLKMEVGSVSPVIPVDQDFVIFKLEDIRFPENPEEREKIMQEVLERGKRKALIDYGDALREKYLKVDENLLASLDYGVEMPEFKKLLEDKRILAEVQGEEPLTVGEFTRAIEQTYYHGVDLSLDKSKAEKEKYKKLYMMMLKKVFMIEALKQGIDKTALYKDSIERYRKSVIFGTFVQKIITPGIKLDLEELKLYYNDNIDEYSSPRMMRIRSLVFNKRDKAEYAIDKLSKGTDFKWLTANADGQIPQNTIGILRFESKVLNPGSFPRELRKAISNVHSGDSRLYASPDGYFYVLYIENVFPSKPNPFEKEKEEIAEKIYADKQEKAIVTYADKLREHYNVTIYATELE